MSQKIEKSDNCVVQVNILHIPVVFVSFEPW